MADITNVLLQTFRGLGLPSTVCLRLPSASTIDDLLLHVSSLLPQELPSSTRLLLTTTSNRPICSCSSTRLVDLTSSAANPRSWTTPAMLPIRLSLPLVGGKGGFGSQLRAAGGRMSSRKKRTAGDPNGSSRNLDGRRLRTITEAKNLATYLATKPEMDRREKEERRKRWEAVVELAERREEDMRKGIGADGRRKGLSEEWVEEKEEVGEGVRNAVALAMARSAKSGPEKVESTEAARESSGSGGSGEESVDDSENDEDVMELDETDVARLQAEAEAGDVDAIWVLKNKLDMQPPPITTPKNGERRFAGFDEDDEFLSSDDDTEQVEVIDSKGKGKAKVMA